MFRGEQSPCPRKCPNRRADPNCHNEATCAKWAAHMEAKRQKIEKIKKEAIPRRFSWEARRRIENQ